jgi:phospholipid/cholesterol/gamma-HCH transport system ATP-binding protein
MIEFRNLHKRFDGFEVLRGVDLRCEEGETLALLGPSGTGKSVLIKHAIGLLEPDEGDVIVDGISIANATPRSCVRCGGASATCSRTPRSSIR